MIVDFPVRITSTTETSASSSSTSSTFTTGTGTAIAPAEPKVIIVINLKSNLDIQAAILRLQMLQSNPSLISSMSNDVRQLVLSLGSGTTSTVKPTIKITPITPTTETATVRDFTNLTDAEHIVYQQERTREFEQTNLQSGNTVAIQLTSKVNEAPMATVL